jgi:drug/metabolite transporter (DMT)-like permease
VNKNGASERSPETGPESAPGPTAVIIVGLLAFVVFAWGLNWIIMKVVVKEITPVWAVAFRTWIAVAVLVPAVALTRQLVPPPRSDLPVVLIISLFHMVAFATLMTAGLKYVSAGRTIVLGYTTPLWVAPAAWIFLREPVPLRRMCGIGLGLAGLLLMFGPGTFNWHDDEALLGNVLVLSAAMCWSVSIVYTRAHRWSATPFQLIVWQTLIAAVILTAIAFVLEGSPRLF